MQVTHRFWPYPEDLVSFFQAATDRTLPPFDNSRVRGRLEATVRVNLGAGGKQIGDSEEIDLPEWDADKFMPLPYGDKTVHAIYAFHVLEHVQDPVWVLRECQRVLVCGGALNIAVPYFRSQGAFHDLDHKHFFGEDTWTNLFSNDYYAKNHHGWEFDIGLNIIMGLNERNLMLLTQLIRN